MIHRAATIAVLAAIVAVFLARPTVPQAAAAGMAALAFLLVIDARRSRTPILKGRKEMLASAVLLTAAAVIAAPFRIGWLAWAAPVAIVAIYVVAAAFLATPAKPGNRSGSSVK